MVQWQFGTKISLKLVLKFAAQILFPGQCGESLLTDSHQRVKTSLTCDCIREHGCSSCCTYMYFTNVLHNSSKIQTQIISILKLQPMGIDLLEVFTTVSDIFVRYQAFQHKYRQKYKHTQNTNKRACIFNLSNQCAYQRGRLHFWKMILCIFIYHSHLFS